MPADRTMELGVLFSARATPTFTQNLRRLRAALMDLDKLMGKVSQTTKAATKATRDHTRTQTKAADAIKKTTKAADFQNRQIRKLTGVWKQLAGAMKVTASYSAAGTLLFGFVNALRVGTVEIIEFDQALKNLQAISGATNAQIGQMRDTMEDVAEKTKFSTTEIAKGMVLLTQAGLSASEAMNAIGPVADLAAGTLSSLEMVTDLVTTSIRAFNLDAIETTRVADVMANAINRSKLTIDKLRIAFNFAGATAAQAGLSIEETAASMMVLANNGLRASTIGTGLRQVLARLLSPGRKLRESYAQFNIELEKINPRTVGFKNALMTLLPVLWDTEKQSVDMAKAFQLFGLRGAQAAAVLAKSFMSEDIRTSFEGMLSYTYEVGASQRMAAKQAEGLAFKFKNLADRAKLLALALGEGGVATVLRVLADSLRYVVGTLTDVFSTKLAQTTLQLTVFTAAILALGKAVQLLGIAFKKTALVQTMTMFLSFRSIGGTIAAILVPIKALIGFLTQPWILVAAGISAVAIAIYKAKTATDDYISSIRNQIEELKNVNNTVTTYRKLIEGLRERMDAGEDVSREYVATFTRLRTDFKKLQEVYGDLIPQVDLTTLSHQELLKVLEDVEKITTLENLKKYLDVISTASAKMFDLYKKSAGGKGSSIKAWFNFLDPNAQPIDTFKDWLKYSKEGQKLFQTMNEASDDLALSLAELMRQGKLTSVELDQFVKQWEELNNVKLTEEVAGNLGDKVALALVQMAKMFKVLKERSEGVKKSLIDLPPAFRAVWDSLDLEQEGRFLTMISSLSNKIATITKEYNLLIKEGWSTTERMEKAIFAARVQALEKFQQKELDLVTKGQDEINKKIKAALKEITKKVVEEEKKRQKARKAGFKLQWKLWDETIKKSKAFTDKLIKDTKSLVTFQLAQLENMSKKDVEYWNKKEVLFKEFLRIESAELREQGKTADEISAYRQEKEKEFYEERIKHLGTYSQGFQLAMDKMRNSLTSWAEVGMKVAEDLRKGLSTAFGESFYNLFVGKIDSLSEVWASFTNSMVRSFANALGVMATQWVLFGDAMGSTGGGAGAPGGGADFFGSLAKSLGLDKLKGAVTGFLNSPIPGLGGTALDPVLGMPMGTYGATWGGALGAGALGGLGYSTFGKMLGLPQGGMSGIGSSLGGAGGFALGAMTLLGGPIGAVLGAIGGGVLGSLFGKKKEPKFDLGRWEDLLPKATYKAGKGLPTHNLTSKDMLEGPGPDEDWQKVSDVYLQTLNQVTGQFNNDVLSLVEALPKEYGDALEDQLEKADLEMGERVKES
ncbi:MAG: phage tail tape measure protein, partial [Tenericutes bacterium]